MPSLSSLIVQRQVATIAEVEQAIARQVLHGGDFLTNLLEVAPHAEVGVTQVLAETLEIAPLPSGRLAAPEAAVLDLVPVETALRYGIFPIDMRASTVIIATSERLVSATLADLVYALGHEILQAAAPIIRIREGIAAHYGAPLEPRQLRLIQKLDAAALTRPAPTFGALEVAEALFSNLKSGISSPPAPVAPPSRRVSTVHQKRVELPTREAEVVGDAVSSAVAPTELPVLPDASAFPSTAPGRGGAASPSAPAPPAGDEPAVAQAAERPRPASELEEAYERVLGTSGSIAPSNVPEGVAVRAFAAEPTVPSRADDPSPMRAPPLVVTSTPALPAISDVPPTVPADSPWLLSTDDVPKEPTPPPSTVERVVESLVADEIASVAQTSPPPAPDALIAEGEALFDSPRPPGMVDKRAIASLLRREVQRPRRGGRSARKKGPFSRSDAEKELALAATAEEVLDIAFAFGSQFFEYTALFAYAPDIIEGRDAFGPGADHQKVQGLGIPTDIESSLSIVRRDGHVLLSNMSELPLDRELRRDLGRANAERHGLVALVPLTIRSRAVGVLMGDDGPQDVSLATLGDLLGFTALASTQLERIAILKKKGRAQAPVSRAKPASVAALARAFSLPTEGLDPTDPTRSPGTPVYLEPRVSPGASSVRPPMAPSEVLPEPPPAAAGASVFGPKENPPAFPRVTTPAVERRPHTLPFERVSSPHPTQETTNAGDAETALAPAAVPVAQPSFPSPQPSTDSAPLADAEGAWVVRPGFSEPPRIQGPASDPPRSKRPASGRAPFVPPIPRTDEDISDVIAEHGDARLRGPDDVDPLLLRMMAGGLAGEEALSEVLHICEIDLPRVLGRFPGPLAVDRVRAKADLPPASDCGPLLKVVVLLGRSVLSVMTVRSTSSDPESRFWATHVLGELLFPEASTAILPRLFDDDTGVRRVARKAAQSLVAAGAGDPLLANLDYTVRSSEEALQRRLLGIESLSDIRAAVVVPILMGVLRDPSELIVDAARAALIAVTRQDLGRNVDVWSAWWALHGNEHRIEWLIQALTHDIGSLRRAAGDELKQITREYFGYYDDLPPRERERAQQRYFEWWLEDGRYRFR